MVLIANDCGHKILRFWANPQKYQTLVPAKIVTLRYCVTCDDFVPLSSFSPSQSFLNYDHSPAIFLVVAYLTAVILSGAALQSAGIKPLSLYKIFIFNRCSSTE